METIVVTFPHTEFGKVQIIRQADGATEAYFQDGDLAYDVDANGTFRDFMGREFLVMLPILGMKSRDARLQLMTPRTIACESVA